MDSIHVEPGFIAAGVTIKRICANEEDSAMPTPIWMRSARNAGTPVQLLRSAATALFFVAALGSVALAQPAVTVSPGSGHPTGMVEVGGTAFGPSEVVDLYFDTTDLALARTDTSGAFGRSLRIPKSAVPGGHTISAVGRKSGLNAQTTFVVRADWLEFRHGLYHHGLNPWENVLSVSSVGQMQLLWSADLGNSVPSSPAVANGVLYVGTGSGVCAIDTATGQSIWKSSTPSIYVYSSPAVANGVVYVGSFDNNLYALDAATGELIWSASTGGEIYSSPALANGVVYIGSEDGKLYAFDTVTGQQLWSAATGNQIQSSPAVANGVVYVGSVDDKLYAFQAATGQPIWNASTGNAVVSSPAVANGVVYVGSGDHNLYAFNAATGLQIWKAATGDQVYSSPAVANGVVYVGSDDNNLYAFNASTGQLLWTGATGSHIEDDSPAVANSVVYVGSDDYSVYAFNAVTGAKLWSATTGGVIYSSPIVVNGVVYAGSLDGHLYAFGLPPGSAAARAAKPPSRPDPATLRPDLTLSLEGQ